MTRTETIKFGDFMNGAYKKTQEEKQRQKRVILKATTRIAALGIVATTTIPMLAVAVPMAGIQALASTGVPAGEVVMAGAISDAVKERIVHAFDPLVELMVSLSLPIASVMITGGALMSMIGFKEKGYGLILSSSLGYILVQLSPMLIDLLFGVGAAV